MANSIDRPLLLRAELDDVPEILALQKIAYQSEAEIYADDSLPALQQTLAEIRADFERMIFLKAVVNGKIIGTVRGYSEAQNGFISRAAVHPYFQRRGIGAKLVREIERVFPPEVARFEAFTGHRSKRNLQLYTRLGYKPFKTEPFLPNIQWVYMQKERQRP